MRQLGVITDYSGLVGLAIAFCFPPLLHMKSEEHLRNLGAPYRTRYERVGSSISAFSISLRSPSLCARFIETQAHTLTRL